MAAAGTRPKAVKDVKITNAKTGAVTVIQVECYTDGDEEATLGGVKDFFSHGDRLVGAREVMDCKPKPVDGVPAEVDDWKQLAKGIADGSLRY